MIGAHGDVQRFGTAVPMLSFEWEEAWEAALAAGAAGPSACAMEAAKNAGASLHDAAMAGVLAGVAAVRGRLTDTQLAILSGAAA